MKQNNYERDWSTHFLLSKESPSGLIRIKDMYGRSSETIAGTKSKEKNGVSSGWQLKFKNVNFYVHRIIWVMTYGSIDPELVIDHLDGNPLNNSIDNLSLKTTTGNLRNRRKLNRNRTNVTGVRLTSRDGKRFYYEAYWNTLDGVQKRKCFHVDKLGEALAKRLAIEHRERQIQELILNGAGYTDRHGK